MTSKMGWIDFSREHRNRVFTVVDMLAETGAIDELGIGAVRDAIANWLFPGVSTIQTRPKYLILISQILLTYLRRFTAGEKVPQLSQFFREHEHNLMVRLAKNYNNEKGHGVIGINVAGRKGELARKPSSIYWNSLKINGIIDTHLSRSEYLQKNDVSGMSYRMNKEESVDQTEEDDFLWEDNFGIKIPPDYGEIAEDVTMNLSFEEASFLRSKFISDRGNIPSGNLLKQLLLNEAGTELMLQAANFKDLANTLLEKKVFCANSETVKVLRIALDFTFLMQGAHIRYNIQLHQLAGIKQFGEDKWEHWCQELEGRKVQLQESLDFDMIFDTLAQRTKGINRLFIKNWLKGVMKVPMDISALDQLVKNQEKNNKGAKAKLFKKSGEYTKWVGLEVLNYRFFNAQTIIKDINDALTKANELDYA